VPKVPVPLTVQPKLGRSTKQAAQPERRVRGDAPLPVHKFVYPGIGYANPLSEGRLRHPQRLEELLQKHFPWVRWGSVGR